MAGNERRRGRMKARWLIGSVIMSTLALATPAVPASEEVDSQADADLLATSNRLVERLEELLHEEDDPAAWTGSAGFAEELRMHAIKLLALEPYDLQAAREFLAEIARMPEVVRQGPIESYWTSRLVTELFGKLVPYSLETARHRKRRAVFELDPRHALGDAAVSHMRRFVTNTNLPMDVRIEAARVMGTEGVPGGAADFIKLLFGHTPLDEESPAATDGDEWQRYVDGEKAFWVGGFLAGLYAQGLLSTKRSSMDQQAGTYVLELDAFYDKAENRDVSLIEAMFRVDDLLGKR